MRRNKLGIAGHYDKGVPIHRAVWAYYNGEIPDGYQIHHIDENPANNGISNLQCLTVSEHRRIHNQVAPVRTFTCQFCGKIFEVRSSAIHSTNYSVKFCSDICRQRHKFIEKTGSAFEDRTCVICGKIFKAEKRTSTQTCCRKCTARVRFSRPQPKITATCEICGETFETNKSNPSRFCSDKCRERHNLQMQRVARTCVICGKEFSCCRYAKTKTCSQKCALALRYKNHEYASKTVERTCVICGKKFTCQKSKPTATCSKSCARKLRWQRTRQENNVEK